LVLLTPTIISGVRGSDSGTSGGGALPVNSSSGGSGDIQAASDDGDLTGGANVTPSSLGSQQSPQSKQGLNGNNNQQNADSQENQGE